MKTMKFLHVLCAAAFLPLLACTSQSDETPVAEQAEPGENIEEILQIPDDQIACYTGGSGQSECKVEPGIKIGDYVTVGCGVKCEEGYYACCGLRCICRPEAQ